MFLNFSLSLIFVLCCCLNEPSCGRLVRVPQIPIERFPMNPKNVPLDIANRFASHQQINKWMDDLCQLYPEMANCSTIGFSLEGRPIKLLKLKGSNEPWHKKAMLLEGGIHSREWAAIFSVIAFGYNLISKPSGQELLENVDWILVPLLNPDGYDRTRRPIRAEFFPFDDHVKSMRRWRKNARATVVKLDFVVNEEHQLEELLPGVDLNRNFPAQWQYNAAKWDQEYAGERAESEPETRAVVNLVKEVKESLIAYLSVHTFGQSILVPYGCDRLNKPKDYDELLRVAQSASKAISAADGHRFYNATHSLDLYSSCGTSDDWAKSIGIKYVYTIELYPENHADEKFFIREENLPKASADLWHFVQAIVDEYNKST